MFQGQGFGGFGFGMGGAWAADQQLASHLSEPKGLPAVGQAHGDAEERGHDALWRAREKQLQGQDVVDRLVRKRESGDGVPCCLDLFERGGGGVLR